MTSESTSYSYTFSHLPQPVTVSVYLYERIANPLQVIDLLSLKNVPYAVLNASMIVSLKEILIGLNRIYSSKESLSSKSLIFYISPESSKGEQVESFKALDFAQPSILIIQTSPLPESVGKIADEVETTVKGEELPISKIGSFINLQQIKKIYGISEQEASLDTEIRETVKLQEKLMQIPELQKHILIRRLQMNEFPSQ